MLIRNTVLLRAILIILTLVIACSSNQKVGTERENETSPNKGNVPQIKTDITEPTTGQKLQQAINLLAEEIKNSISDGRLHKAAVMPLTTLHGEQTDLGLFITDKLTSALSVGNNQVEMVERSKINEALTEIKLGESGLLSEETIQRTGKALGVDAVIVGNITDLGQEVDINVRIFSVSTLKILGRATQLIPKDIVVSTLLNKVSPISQQTVQTPVTEDSKPTERAKYTYYDDFKSSDFSRYQITGRTNSGEKAGTATFNPEAGIVEVTTSVVVTI